MPEIHDTALLRNVDIGDGSTVWAYSNLYDCVVGEDCLIGPYVELQAGVKLGDDVSIQSHSFLCQDMIVEDEAWIGHGVQTINNHYPPGLPPWDPPVVRKSAVIGTSATLMPVEIGQGAVVGAGAVVLDDVPPDTTVVGNPARPLDNRGGRTW